MEATFIHQLNLEYLLRRATKLIETLNEEKRNDLEVIKQRYDYYIKRALQPLRNNHYANCIRPNYDQYNSTSKDFCECHYLERLPKELCFEIVEKFGLSMLNF